MSYFLLLLLGLVGSPAYSQTLIDTASPGKPLSPGIIELPVEFFLPTATPAPAVMRRPTAGRHIPMKLPQGSGDAVKWKPRPEILSTVDRILALPEDEIDVGRVALTLAKDAFPDLDVSAASSELDRIAAKIRAITPLTATPDYRVRAMNTVLYREMGIDYDKSDYGAKKRINRYVNGVIQTKRGTCGNLGTFYIAVAQRLGYPVYAVAAPQHVFARYVEPNGNYKNIEPTGKGGWSSDQKYIDDMHIPQAGIDNGVYMRTMTHRELAAELVADHGAMYYGQEKKNYMLAVEIIGKALNNAPLGAEFRSLLGQLLIKESHRAQLVDFQMMYYMTGSSFMMGAEEMGIAPPLKDDYWKKPRPSS
jgi:regulator of sirC expression with transglutaminase-like and TPR domain